jgi:hypothetical protein
MRGKHLPIIGLFIILVTHALDAAGTLKLYEVPKAEVTYKISGGGPLSTEVNLTLEGEGKLRFKEWGAVELIERHIVERTTGVIHYSRKQDSCEKRQEKQIYDVDFKNKRILERSLPGGKKVRDLTDGLTKYGQQMVANVVCNMWVGKGIRRCIYKGIPLFTEYRALGLYYREDATDVNFDINITEPSGCAIPEYPVRKFSLYTNNFKTKNKKPPKSFSKRLLKAIEMLESKKGDEEKLPEKEKKALIQMIGAPIFEEQKALLPKLLETLKKTRACLVQAKETAMANACLYDLLQIKSYFTGNSHNRIDDWTKDRERILNTFDENIIALQSKMKCIRGAKNIHDLSACMTQ